MFDEFIGKVRNMKNKLTTKTETLRGYLVATDWDIDDNVTEVCIQTEDDEYVIDLSNARGRELYDFLDDEIKITGIVRKGRRGTKIVIVMDYEKLGEEDDFQFYYNTEPD
jgi:hypothetical protein